MTLGEKLKELRLARNFSQPELAQAAAIEQSYLSKLENDKSLPSNEVFRQLLAALSVELSDLLHCPKLKSDLTRLKQIPDIDAFLSQRQQFTIGQQRRWWYISSALIVIAVTLFYIGQNERLFAQQLYQYQSKGVVLEGEPEAIFNTWIHLMPQGVDRAVKDAKQQEMLLREAIDTRFEISNLGDAVTLEVEGGRRYYEYQQKIVTADTISPWFRIVGVLLFCMGLMGFVLERKMFKHVY